MHPSVATVLCPLRTYLCVWASRRYCCLRTPRRGWQYCQWKHAEIIESLQPNSPWRCHRNLGCHTAQSNKNLYSKYCQNSYFSLFKLKVEMLWSQKLWRLVQHNFWSWCKRPWFLLYNRWEGLRAQYEEQSWCWKPDLHERMLTWIQRSNPTQCWSIRWCWSGHCSHTSKPIELIESLQSILIFVSFAVDWHHFRLHVG